jgi:hypothetical protein
MNDTRSLKWQIRGFSAWACRSAAVVVLAWLIAAAAIVVFRWQAGALRSPLDPAALITAGVMVAIAGIVVRLGWLLPSADDTVSRWDHAVMLATLLAVVALFRGLSEPSGTPRAALAFLLILFLTEEGGAWFWFIRKWQRPAKRGQNYFPPAASPSTPSVQKKDSPVSSSTGQTFRFDGAHPSKGQHVSHVEAVCDTISEAEPLDTAPPPEVMQQLTRSQAADGTEELFGWIRLPFAAGQRTGSIHIAFCPPLAVTPEVEVEQIEGPDARVKTAQLLPYGARFDLKLNAAAEDATTVVLQFMAKSQKG